MEKTTYEDYKYCLQDAGSIYLGAKYTFQEILDNEEINFKLRLVVNKYILPEADPEDSIESHLYYLDSKSFLVKLYDRLKVRVKVNVIEEKKLKQFSSVGKTASDIGAKTGGGIQQKYVTKTLTIKELTAIPAGEKERKGMVIQEIKFSKLALLGI